MVPVNSANTVWWQA